jgi:hypothetical protein
MTRVTEQRPASRILTFGGSTVRIEHSGRRSAEIVEFLFKRFPADPSAVAPAAVLRLLENASDGSFTLSNRGAVCCVDRSAGVMASWLLHLTCMELALGGGGGGLLRHAAAVACAGHSLLLPGATGSGKSTLAAFLTARGFQYQSDELVHVAAASTAIEGFTAPLKIKKPGLAALDGHLPLLTGGPATLMGHDDVLVDLATSRCAAGPRPLSVIVFPRFRPRSRFQLKALSPSQTGLRLMAGILNAGALPDHGFRKAARMAGSTAAFEMTFANLGQIEARLERLRTLTSTRQTGRRPGGSAGPRARQERRRAPASRRR